MRNRLELTGATGGRDCCDIAGEEGGNQEVYTAEGQHGCYYMRIESTGKC
jgi:hypothetical protein